jgi:hypothetical protein
MTDPTAKSFGLDEAIALAREVHGDVLDKSGQPYIEHPLRVMAMVSGEDTKIVAVLHDAIEDTSLTAEDLLARGCPRHIVDAILAVTHPKPEPMESYLQRVVSNPLALEVKWADLNDNNDPRRVAWMRQHNPAKADHFKTKYSGVLTYLAIHSAEKAQTRHMVERLLTVLDRVDPVQAAAVRQHLGRPAPALG